MNDYDDDDELKEGLMKSMSQPAKKPMMQKPLDEEKKKKDWESKFERNRG